MILYHTSDQVIKHPDVHHGRKNADFGWGFYLTPDRDFARRWAKENAIVNEYELDETGLDIYRFSRSREWFEYIFHNRRLRDDLSADVIIGPIANDTIFDTMGIISSGYLEADEALKLLMVGPEYTQVAIKNAKAIEHLKWQCAEKIERTDDGILKREQDAYQREVADVLNKLTR